MALTTPAEIEKAYLDKHLRWLHKRFYVYAWTLGIGWNAISLLGAVLGLVVIALGKEEMHGDDVLAKSAVFWVSFFLKTTIVALVFVASILWVRRNHPQRDRTIQLIYWLFVGPHLIDILYSIAVWLWIDQQGATDLLIGDVSARLLFSHFIAALIIPWTVRESALVLAPVVAIRTVLIALLATDPVAGRAVAVLGLGLAGLPGICVCWIKQYRFRRGFQFEAYRDAFQHVSREVSQARQLHESFFPKPIDTGPLRLDYAYQPMAQLGGDYIHAQSCRDGQGRAQSLLCAVIDVTGHGLSATLTANHLHALIKRQTQHSERPDPGNLIAELNRYMYESFSGMSVFATALCMRLDVRERRVVWASAGHPPGLLSQGGSFEPILESTTFMLGAVPPEGYQSESQSLVLTTDCSVIAYSDGASELPLAQGGMLGIKGLCQHLNTLSTEGRLTCRHAMDSLNEISTGERQDDILLARLDLNLQDEGPAN